ncbi:hypothetical protein SAY87_022951 [Trapa incisa]|uniref:Pentatricopeptide repeat-containing protein n=1 Tax=Trapa incisa TaxID=236973 RepID=A0AAN7KB21_9MYRT|nr:hypothetical protein SAY87_022951 [Trapa incisa]
MDFSVQFQEKTSAENGRQGNVFFIPPLLNIVVAEESKPPSLQVLALVQVASQEWPPQKGNEVPVVVLEALCKTTPLGVELGGLKSLCPHRPIIMTTALIREVKRLASGGLYSAALELYKLEIHPSGLHAATSILPSIIRACASSRIGYPLGLQLHGVALKSGSCSDSVMSNSIISMYSKLSMPGSAWCVFDEMPHRDPISWNSLINCFLQNGFLRESLEALREMCLQYFFPRPELAAGLVSVCGHSGKLRLGKQIHARVLFDPRSEGSVLLSTALLHMYLTCHDSWMGFHVFDRMPIKNEVSWTALISGCIANNEYEMSISCLRKMQCLGLSPNRVTMICLLQACVGLGSLKHGKEIHGYGFRRGFDSEDRFSAALLHMYCECKERLTRSRTIFESCRAKDVVAWSSMVRSYLQAGEAASAMELFGQMRKEGIRPNSVTLLAVISTCTLLSSLTLAQSVHGYLIKSALNRQVFIENSLIDMYSKCGCLPASHQVFSEMAGPDLVSWSTLVAAYGLHGHGEVALQLFHCGIITRRRLGCGAVHGTLGDGERSCPP